MPEMIMKHRYVLCVLLCCWLGMGYTGVGGSVPDDGDARTRRKIVFSSASSVEDVLFFEGEELLEQSLTTQHSSVEIPPLQEKGIEVTITVHFDQMLVMVREQIESEQVGEGVPQKMEISIYECVEDPQTDQFSDSLKNEHEPFLLLWWTSVSLSNETQIKRFLFTDEELWPISLQQEQPVSDDTPPADSSPKFSSFHCLYSSQTFPFWNITMPKWIQEFYPSAEEELRRHRICVYKDVCFMDKEFIYFENDHDAGPERMRYSEITPLHHYQSQTYLSQGDYPTMPVRHESIPEGMPYVDSSRVYFFQQQSQTYNFAHCLLEDILPIHMTMDIFNLGSYDKAILLHDCNSMYQSEEVMAACGRNIKQYGALLDLEVVDARNLAGRTLCFPTLVMGHSMALSIWHLNKLETPYLRAVRDKIVTKFGFQTLLPPTSHRVLVLLKSSFGFAPNGRASAWQSICEDVTSLMNTLNSVVTVECVVPTIHNNKELTYAMHKATVILSEDGTVSLNSLFFGREGCVHVIKGRNVNPTFWSAHIKYLYFDELDELAAVLPFALRTAGQDLGLHVRHTTS